MRDFFYAYTPGVAFLQPTTDGIKTDIRCQKFSDIGCRFFGLLIHRLKFLRMCGVDR